MITFFTASPFASGGLATLTDDPAVSHARARRVRAGDDARLLDGRGQVGQGVIAGVSRSAVTVEVRDVRAIPRPHAVYLIVPVADRDRMLIAAEKATELQVSVWQPVLFERSRSVTPRGEGEKFHAKARARMISALEQSGGAWLPEMRTELDAESGDPWATVPTDVTRLVLDRDGSPLLTHALRGSTALAVGPEGGLTPAELAGAERAGWLRASLGPATLRFETAVIAGLAVLRAAQQQQPR